MPGRPRTMARALGFYSYLRGHQDEHMTIAELCRRAPGNYLPTATTRHALRRVAALAEADGLCLRVPCPENGYTLMLTVEPRAIEPSARWLGRTEQGIHRRRGMHTSVMAANLDRLAPAERAAMERQLALEAQLENLETAVRAVAEASAEVLSDAVAATRRPE
jgi:hypothetical protein